MTCPLTTALIIPTLNAEGHFTRLLPAIKRLEPPPDEIMIIDSSSNDSTVELARAAGCRAVVIERKEFGHGYARNLASTLVCSDILMYMTQDAIPADKNLVKEVLAAFADTTIAHVFVRQTPHDDATPSAAFSRHFNYPAHSYTRSLDDVMHLGLRAFFTSNSCAAYRREVFEKVGRFPENIPVSEDTMVAARMLNTGYGLKYIASTHVQHSHNYSLSQEFKRYFDIGVSHQLSPWYLSMAPNVGSEGRRYVKEETACFIKRRLWAQIASAIIRNALRLTAYRLGRHSNLLPLPIKKRLSMHSYFWSSPGRSM